MTTPLSAPVRARFSEWTCVISASTTQRWGRDILPLSVSCRFGKDSSIRPALWDTASAWSVIGPGTAASLEDDLGAPEMAIAISTRFGRKRGALRRLMVTLPAVQGDDFVLECVCLALDDSWEGPTVLGVRGFMDRLRFAVHLGATASDEPLLALAIL